MIHDEPESQIVPDLPLNMAQELPLVGVLALARSSGDTTPTAAAGGILKKRSSVTPSGSVTPTNMESEDGNLKKAPKKNVSFKTLPESDEDERMSTAQKIRMMEKAKDQSIELILNEPRTRTRSKRVIEESDEENEEGSDEEVMP